MAKKRQDKNRVVLQVGEKYRESDDRYSFRWTDATGKRHEIYAKTLVALRKKKSKVAKDIADDIKAEAQSVTLNQIYKTWKDIKRGLKNTTYQNYCYMYDTFVLDSFGKKRIASIKKSDVKRFYNTLAEERELSTSTIDSIHTVIHQLFRLAVEDNYIRANPSDDALRELKKAWEATNEKRRALTQEQETAFLEYIQKNPMYRHWYPIFAVMVYTGLRVGEVTGLRWQDIDLVNGVIDVNHTLVYYAHRIVKPGEKKGCYFAINSTKTPASKRKIPMLESVKQAFLMEKQYQREAEIKCQVTIDGYTDFIFVNRFGNTQHQGTLNKAIRRIVRDYNMEAVEENVKRKKRGLKELVMLPNFSCHTLRHTFATRMCEKGVNIKVIQDVMGHTDISTTLNIYTDATKDLKTKEFKALDEELKKGSDADKNTDETLTPTDPNFDPNENIVYVET